MTNQNTLPGEKIIVTHGVLQVPDHPIIPFIEGDGTGPDIGLRPIEYWIKQ